MNISDNTKAILLLTAPLLLSKNSYNIKLLTHTEYHQLATYLHSRERQPADLLTTDLDDILDSNVNIDKDRLQQLLNRGFLLSQVLDYWYSRNIWVISRADEKYPSNFKKRLKSNAPPILYGCGNIDLLNLGGFAIVGSRHINDELVTYTKEVAQLAAHSGKMVISGGAKGTDYSAMQGALDAGGNVCGVLADNLEKEALNPKYRNALQENKLIFISANDPKSRFFVANAMQRNKYIYALSDAALVVNSDLKKGGTWAGAIEQLDKYQQIPIYIRSTGIASDGLNALKEKGALPWSNPNNKQTFNEVFVDYKSTNIKQHHKPAEQLSLLDIISNKPNNSNTMTEQETKQNIPTEKTPTELLPNELLFEYVSTLIKHLTEKSAKKESELSEALGVSNTQMKNWLARLVNEKAIIKQQKPVRYLWKI